MPRYFFHTADGSRERDEEGTELPDHNAARREAIKLAGAVLSEQPDVLWHSRDFRVEVTDDAVHDHHACCERACFGTDVRVRVLVPDSPE